MPAESIPAFKLTELVPHATIVPGAIYNTVLVLGINEDKWKSLKQEDREAIMKISGDAFAAQIGRAYANGDKAAYDTIRQVKGQVETLAAPVVAELKKALQPIETDWTEKAKKKGVAQPERLINQLRAELSTK